MIKPFFLCDLDDTLFQTQRKILDYGYSEAFQAAAVDQTGQARSFMTEKQANLVNWLLQSAYLVPVTARGTEEISRVLIPFDGWKITTHGAVVLDADNQPDRYWQNHIESQLALYQPLLIEKQALLTARFAEKGIKSWARINTEYDNLNVYIVAKHTDSTQIHELYQLCDEIDKETGLEGFYVHRNSNNIAWLPNCIEKGLAVNYLLEKIRQSHPFHPILGFGDSKSDYPFLSQCDWFGMPNQGQIKQLIHTALTGQDNNC